MQIQIPQFRNELFLLGIRSRFWADLCSQKKSNAQLSLPADNFYSAPLKKYDFMKGIRLNIAVEQDDHSFFKLTVKCATKLLLMV
jgi:UPF0176 protein